MDSVRNCHDYKWCFWHNYLLSTPIVTSHNTVPAALLGKDLSDLLSVWQSALQIGLWESTPSPFLTDFFLPALPTETHAGPTPGMGHGPRCIANLREIWAPCLTQELLESRCAIDLASQLSFPRICRLDWRGGGKADHIHFPPNKHVSLKLLGKEGSFAKRKVKTRGTGLELFVPSCHK